MIQVCAFISMAMCWAVLLLNRFLIKPDPDHFPDVIDRVGVGCGAMYFWLTALSGMFTGRLLFYPVGEVKYDRKPQTFVGGMLITLAFACVFSAGAVGIL